VSELPDEKEVEAGAS